MIPIYYRSDIPIDFTHKFEDGSKVDIVYINGALRYYRSNFDSKKIRSIWDASTYDLSGCKCVFTLESMMKRV